MLLRLLFLILTFISSHATLGTSHTVTGVIQAGSYKVRGIDHVFYDGRSAKMPQRRLAPGLYRIADLAGQVET